MLKQRTRTVVASVVLLFAVATSSALGALGVRPATKPAARASHGCRAARRIHRKREAIVHCAAPRSAAVASATVLLGDSSVESRHDSLAAGQAEAFRLQASETGPAGLVHVYVSATNTASTVVAGLYSSGYGHPGSLLSTGSASASRANTWVSVPITPIELLSGKRYWLAILGTGGTLRYRDRSRGPCQSQTSAQTALDALPAYWSTGAVYDDCPASAYVTAGDAAIGLDTEPPAGFRVESSTSPDPPPAEEPPASGDPAPTNTVPPSIAGDAIEGQELGASSGTWTGSPTSYAYQWQDCNSSGESCSNISSASASSYQLTSGDIGYTLRVVVTATNAGGSTSATSAPTALVSAPPTPAPTNTAPPSLSGSAVEGQTLSVSSGTWTGSPTSYTYQWQDCDSSGESCSNITAATNSTYKLASSDVGHTVRALVTATNAAGSTPAASAPTVVITTQPSYRTFYVDYESGSESNSGTSETAPWKRAPGMHGFTASYSHKPGDHFIFKGGVTWPNAAFPDRIESSGAAGNSDYYGVSDSWHTGASYTAPIFNAEDKEITNAGSGDNFFMDFHDERYITVEGIHFKGWAATNLGANYGQCAVINASSTEHTTLNRLTINEFTVGAVSASDPSGPETNKAREASENARCTGIAANASSAGVIENSVIEGPSTGAFVEGIRDLPSAYNNTIKDLSQGYFPGNAGVIAGNHIEDCFYPNHWGYTAPEGVGLHMNMMEFGESITGPYYVYDNVIRGTGAGFGGECEATFFGTGTVYAWNNVYSDIEGNGLDLETKANTSGRDYILNNSIEGAGLGTGSCVRAGHGGEMALLEIKNNFCIGKEVNTSEKKAASEAVEHNLVLLNSEVSSKGYSTIKEVEEARASYIYAPKSGSAAGVGRGENLTSACSGELAGLCSDTSYAGLRTGEKRPSSGSWDIGAYEW